MNHTEQAETIGLLRSQINRRKNSMSFIIYIIGFMVFIGGLIYGAVLLNIQHQWIAVGAIILLGLSILTGVKATRHKDPAE
jgi:predicted membrane channel-forming protein YqfA (hemolysin III family)